MRRVLTVVRGTALGSDSDGATESFADVRSWFRHWSILRRLFRYDEVRVRTHAIAALPRPLATVLAIRVLSRGSCVIEDELGQTASVSFRSAISLAVRASIDYLEAPRLLRRARSVVTGPRPTHAARRLDLTRPALYLRTDITFGLTSGGSVGHIAGVVNSLTELLLPPILATTDAIPTTRPEVTTWILSPNGRFRDFTELPLLAFNDVAFEEVSRRLGKIQPGFIYQRYGLENFTGALLADATRVPFVLEYNGSEVWVRRVWSASGLKYADIASRIEEFNFERADLIVVVSRVLADELVGRGVDEAKILVNPNGVDVDRFCPDIDGGPTRADLGVGRNMVALGFLGTFGPWHGAEVLARAFVELLRREPALHERVRLVLIGDGQGLPETRRILRDGGGEAATVFVGQTRQEDAPRYLAACDVLISPHVPNADGSRFFGSPTKLFEYMAMGKGIVASNLEQIGEVLDHDRTGWLVKPGDVDDLVAGMRLLIDGPERRFRLGRAAREQAVSRHTWLEHTRRIVEKLQSVTAEREP